MVQHDPFSASRIPFTTRGPSWMEPSPEVLRHHESQDNGRRQPMKIAEALQHYCHIPGKHYFVAAFGDDGRANIFSPSLTEQAIQKFFNQNAFEYVCDQTPVQTPSTATSQYEQTAFPFENDAAPHSAVTDRRWSQERRYGYGMDVFEDDSTYKTRKRPRPATVRREACFGEDTDVRPVVSAKKSLVIGNEKELWDFYDHRFKNCQQTACKLIAKAWIKAVEPKKQSNHPYTGKDERAPDWWPKSKEQKVRHKEPDHLYKKERVYLLNHILSLIVQPNERQHKDIQKLRLNVTKLEEITNEALSAFFADKENPSNAKKRPFLAEIFQVAKYEERLLAGEIDGTTTVYVMSEEKASEDGDEDESTLRFEDEQDQSSVSPPRRPPTSALMAHVQDSDHSPATHLQDGQFMDANSMSAQRAQYQQHVIGPEMPPEVAHYGEGSAISSQGSLQPSTNMSSEMYAGNHDSSRRSSYVNGPTEYSSPTQGIYHQGWGSATTPPGNSTMYAFTPATAVAPQYGQTTVAIAQNQQAITQNPQYVGVTGFDGLPGRAQDVGHSTLYRANSLSQPSVSYSPGYPSYLPQDNRAVINTNVKPEAQGRSAIP